MDYSEGLMAEIQKLIKPPDEEPRQSVPRKPSYRRAGRHNNDLCSACDEGGNLICCDTCVSSFHLQCHDPPLEEEDIPSGVWLCHTCRETKKRAELQAAAATSMEPMKSLSVVLTKLEQTISRPATPTASDTTPDVEKSEKLPEKGKGSRKGSKSSRKSSASSDSSTKNTGSGKCLEIANLPKIDETVEAVEEVVEEVKPPEPVKLSPLQELVRAARLMNPKQFELPRELSQPLPFPGTDRVEVLKNGRKVSRLNRKTYELDSQSLVPLPARVCFTCRKSCKKAPLLACDYCNLLFHQDCLDPPLTALPAGLWMCPNHAEQFIDWNLVTSSSATERIQLWNRFSQPMDHEAVKLEFFRRVHNKNPPFRVKRRFKPQEKVEIPESVEWHYKNPPSLLPSHRDIMRCDNVKKRGISTVDFIKPSLLVEDVDKTLGYLQSARKKLKVAMKDMGVMDIFNDDFLAEVEELKQHEAKLSEIAPEIMDVPEETVNVSEDAVNPEVTTEEPKKDIDMKDVPKKDEIEQKVDIIKENIEIKKEDEGISLICEETIEAVEKLPEKKEEDLNVLFSLKFELKNLDEQTIRILAYQRLKQLVTSYPEFMEKFQTSSAVTEIAQQDANKNKNSLSNLGVLTKDEIEKISKSVSDGFIDSQAVPLQKPFSERTDEEKAHSIAKCLQKPIKQSQIRARAVFTPVNEYLNGDVWYTAAPTLNMSVHMKYRSFKIGSGPGSDLNLKYFGNCAFVSNNHAIIFYDEVTKQFELLNYSEFGSEVNGVIYTCDFTEHSEPIEPPVATPPKEKRGAVQSKIKNLLDAKKKDQKMRDVKEAASAKCSGPIMAASEPPICNCKGRSSMLAGWEGTALINHGYLLKFGCISFVFSVADYDSGNED